MCRFSTDDCADEGTFRNMIVWLEDTKIRHYKIEDRAGLRDVNAPTWPAALAKVIVSRYVP